MAILATQNDFQKAGKYWNKLKKIMLLEGIETVTNCNGFKVEANDAKFYKTDVSGTEQLHCQFYELKEEEIKIVEHRSK